MGITLSDIGASGGLRDIAQDIRAGRAEDREEQKLGIAAETASQNLAISKADFRMRTEKFEAEKARGEALVPMEDLERELAGAPNMLGAMQNFLTANNGIETVGGKKVTRIKHLQNYQEVVSGNEAMSETFLNGMLKDSDNRIANLEKSIANKDKEAGNVLGGKELEQANAQLNAERVNNRSLLKQKDPTFRRQVGIAQLKDQVDKLPAQARLVNEWASILHPNLPEEDAKKKTIEMLYSSKTQNREDFIINQLAIDMDFGGKLSRVPDGELKAAREERIGELGELYDSVKKAGEGEIVAPPTISTGRSLTESVDIREPVSETFEGGERSFQEPAATEVPTPTDVVEAAPNVQEAEIRDILGLPTETLPSKVSVAAPEGGFPTESRDKGPGFFGTLQRPDGDVSTELSIGVDFDGEEREIPTLVPTLTENEKQSLLKGNKPSERIIDKAVSHARKRLRQGKSPFREADEEITEGPTGIFNNPGNIEKGQEFQGEVADDSFGDGRFAVFDTPQNGIRAMARVLLTYQKSHKINTVDAVINRYSPDDSRKNYKAFVARRLGIGINTKFDINNNLEKLVRAMIDFENGPKSRKSRFYSPFIDEGVESAR